MLLLASTCFIEFHSYARLSRSGRELCPPVEFVIITRKVSHRTSPSSIFEVEIFGACESTTSVGLCMVICSSRRGILRYRGRTCIIRSRTIWFPCKSKIIGIDRVRYTREICIIGLSLEEGIVSDNLIFGCSQVRQDESIFEFIHSKLITFQTQTHGFISVTTCFFIIDIKSGFPIEKEEVRRISSCSCFSDD